MDNMQKQIQQTLIANILKDKCKNYSEIIFEESWCTQDRVLRFSTPFFRVLFSVGNNEKGKWKTGDFVMYEVKLTYDAWEAACIFNSKDLPKDQLEHRNHLLKNCGITTVVQGDDIVLMRWYSPAGVDTDGLFDSFEKLVKVDIPKFENKINAYKITESGAGEVKEGEEKTVTLSTYERNPVARKKCLEAHGTACAVCGMDFGKKYGPEFDGKIEVHHIVPISQIGKEYVIDPINDLVPVCPNCHTALHSKKGGGVYTVEELREMMGK